MIELKGVNVANKGAHLMLLSIFEEFKKRQHKENFCIEPGFGMNFFSAAKNGLYLRANFKGKKLPWSTILAMLPSKTLKNYGLVLDKHIDIILDASGFAYGDFWGADKIERRLENYLSRRTSSNSKLILLPQALGPFNDSDVKSAFGKVMERADLIFARDEVSYKHLISNYGERESIKIAPDFTNLLDSGSKRDYEEGKVCIIPNYKMIQEENDREKYFSFLIQCINYIRNLGKKAYFLIHEGEKDKKIARVLNEQLEKSLPIVEPEDPMEIKNRIKSAELIIVSRFHGLVSALSQGVPALTTSWSHKYKELVKDYKLEDSIIDIYDYEADAVEAKISGFLGRSQSGYYESQKVFIDSEKEKSRVMWNKVFDLIYG